MSNAHVGSAISSALGTVYARVFHSIWPAWLGGLLLGIISIATFAWARPWGVVGGLREWVDWTFYWTGIYGSHPRYNVLLSSSSILTGGLIWGALVSAFMSKRFAFKIPPPFEMVRASIGGTLMGIGAAMAMGCNVGGFFSASSALSLSGPAMMAGLIVGVILEVRYIYWELQTFRFRRGDGKPRKTGEGSFDFKVIQPYLGAFLIVTALLAAFAYRHYGDAIKSGGLLLLALSFGFVVHRSRFAFVKAFREPFINGNADKSKGMAIAVIVSVLGFAALKGWDLRPEGTYVMPTFWLGSFVGGVIFGFGMPFAGGCASGCCWRSAEGGLKQIIAFLFMGVSNSLSTMAIRSSESLSSLMGTRVFLPNYISYHWTIVLIVGIMLAYYLVTSWNEKTKAFI